MRNIPSKIITVFLLFAGFSLTAFAQDYSKVDAKVKTYPNSFSSVDKFAETVNKDFNRDDEKARAIFTWIAHNIKYDLKAYGVNQRPVAYSYKTEAEKLAKQKKFKEDLALKTLKSKKGVCQGYSTLYAETAEKAGLEAVIITGSSKSHPAHIGKRPGNSDHAWNAVKIGGEWRLIDVTWGAGTAVGDNPKFVFKFNDKYFFGSPDLFFLNHFPDDKKWLLTNKTEQEFADLPLYYGNYHMEGYQFVSPALGTFTNSKSTVVPFRIKNVKPTDTVVYVFSRTNAFKEVKPVINNGVAEFDVTLTTNSNGLLTIYINGKSIATYRIERG